MDSLPMACKVCGQKNARFFYYLSLMTKPKQQIGAAISFTWLQRDGCPDQWLAWHPVRPLHRPHQLDGVAG